MDKKLEVIINSIPTAVLLGSPMRDADNKIYDVKEFSLSYTYNVP